MQDFCNDCVCALRVQVFLKQNYGLTAIQAPTSIPLYEVQCQYLLTNLNPLYGKFGPCPHPLAAYDRGPSKGYSSDYLVVITQRLMSGGSSRWEAS